MIDTPFHGWPKARTERLAVQRVDDELVVYDELTQTAHCLSADAAAIWGLCDGERSVEEIARELGQDPVDARRAVAELQETALLEDLPQAVGISRREAAKRMAKVGGAALAARMVYSVAIPAAAAAASCATQGTSVNCSNCSASAGGFGTVTGTSCTCYKANNSSGCWYTTSMNSCAVKGGSCSTLPCCDPGVCNGSHKCDQ